MALNIQRTPQRGRQRDRIITTGNKFDFDESKIPPGMKYQWIRATIGGQEDPENLIMAEQNGWTPVPAARHRELSGSRAAEDAEIRRGGLILMEQPQEWYEESQELDRFAATHAVESQIARLGLQARRDGVKKPFSRSKEVITDDA